MGFIHYLTYPWCSLQSQKSPHVTAIPIQPEIMPILPETPLIPIVPTIPEVPIVEQEKVNPPIPQKPEESVIRHEAQVPVIPLVSYLDDEEEEEQVPSPNKTLVDVPLREATKQTEDVPETSQRRGIEIPIMTSARRMKKELDNLIEDAMNQSTMLEENKLQIEQQLEEITSLEEANTLMVKQLKANQESAAQLQDELLKAKLNYIECNTKLELENGKVMALTVQLTKRDH